MITEQDVIDYMNSRTWFNVGIQYKHDNEFRDTFVRAQTIQDAIKRFEEMSDDPIIDVFLFDQDTVEEWKK